MAVREYVGARYVPVFSSVNGGVWNNTYSYEALTIVKYGTDFYTSRVPVPVGAAITNTDYWIKTGDYNGAISTLQSEIGDLYDVKAYEMGSRTFLFMADSYDLLGDFVDKVGNDINCKAYYKRTMGGACFVRHDEYSARNYVNILSNLNPLTLEEMAEITDVVVCASVNDAPNDADDMKSAMTAFDTYVKNHMPNVKRIHLVSIGWHAVNGGGQSKDIGNLRMYSHYAPLLGWSYVDCTRVMRLCKWVDPSDGYHPTATAGIYIAECVTMAILTGSCSWVSPGVSYNFTMTLPSVWSGANIVRPSGSAFAMNAQCNAAGLITCRFTSDILLTDVDMTSFDRREISLALDNPYQCPIPRYSHLPLVASSGSNGAVASWLQMDSGNVNLAIEVLCGGSNFLATDSLRVMDIDILLNMPGYP